MIQTSLPPPPDDVDFKSIMMERLSRMAARGGLAMEETLKKCYAGRGVSSSCSFVYPEDPDHHLFKQKIAEYTKFPPRLPLGGIPTMKLASSLCARPLPLGMIPLPPPRPLHEKPEPKRTSSLFARPPVGMIPPPPLHDKAEPKIMMHPPPPLHEEPETKREKLQEDEFCAHHPGLSTFTICVKTGVVLKITVQSLSETVGSLKEKIAGELGIPANQQKLFGKTGFLKDDNMPLAHYGLGAVEKLRLTY
ncbi:PREDICTED: probable splicing factor 3A subunit 1 [Camelina sativa]|uniref:Probable splicing factor 3A subunit 1 n=1 Tax=Camelina sativa TaxID=90675 RepID=A0ABM0Z2Y1_CAMSA|nr:PREDICTED: probable splicing factor 3A subunit 1 [Camelina sativa]